MVVGWKSASTPQPPIMSWQEVTDEEGRVYYYNSETEQTQWERPEELSSALDRALSQTQWKKFTTEENKTYYYNEQTEQTQWEVPEEVTKLLENKTDSEDAQNSSSKADVAEAYKDVEFDQDEPSQIPTGPASGRENGWGNQLINMSGFLKENSNLVSGLSGIDAYVSSGESDKGADDFVKMLEEKKVDSTWSFNKVMETFIKDPRYWAVEDSLLRKQFYEVYLIRKADRELKEVENSRESYKEAFFQVLDNHDVRYTTRWKTCSKMIIDEPIYSLIPNKMKKEFFDEYVSKLRVEHDSELKATRKHELKQLEAELEGKVQLTSKFDEVLESLDLSRYPHLQHLDVITVYENIVHELEVVFDQKVKEHSKVNYRSDRKARDEFRELLEELKANPEVNINAKLQWFEFVALIKDDARFLNLCGRKGSSAIDFYWDILDKESQILKAKRDLVKQVLISSKIELPKEGDSDVAEFVDQVKSLDNKQINQELKSSDFPLVFDLLVEEDKTAKSIGSKRKLEPVSSGNDSAGAKKKRLMTLGYGALT